MTITPTRQEKLEWARLAQAAYGSDQNDIGHRFSGLASIPDSASLPITVYDTAMAQYRSWLIDNEYPEKESSDEDTTLSPCVRWAVVL